MRAAAYASMAVLVVSAVAVGVLWPALVGAGIKTLIVGLEFMELRRAARPHMVAFVLGTAALTGLLVALT